MGTNLTMLTDLYQLTMAYGYWKNGMENHEAVFHLFFRKHPFKGQYTMVSGLEQAIQYLENLKFDLEDVRYLASLTGNDGLPLFDEGFLNYLQRFKFSCDVDAMPEGSIAFPHQPVVRVKGNLIQAQLIETALLNIINFSSLISTKAARIKSAAGEDTVLEFGLRRAQGPDGAMMASRAAYVGGCDATSNVLAGKTYGIPVKGTHAHSWVLCFDSEMQAFEAYAAAMPANSILLVDTYDTVEGVRKAVEIGNRLRQNGHRLGGVRLDSGDLAELSIAARRILDEGGFPDAAIVASNDLDEYRIKELKERGATIKVWGVGTRLATAYDQPALGGVYKLAAIRVRGEDWKFRVKLSEQAIKVSNPGVLNTFRMSRDGQPIGDVIYSEEGLASTTRFIPFRGIETPFSKNEGTDLLIPIFRKGNKIYDAPSLSETRRYGREQLALFQQLDNYPVGLESALHHTKIKIIEGFSTL